MSFISAGVGLASVGLSAYKYFDEKGTEKKAERELQTLKAPFYKIQDEYNQNRNIAASQAGQGVPSSVENYVTNQNQEAYGTGVGAIQKAGGSATDIAKLFKEFSGSVNKFGAEQSETQLKNMALFMKANQDVAGQKTIQWGVNEYNPYENKLKEITQRIGASKINQNNSLNDIISSAGSVATSLSNSDLINGLFTKDPIAGMPHSTGGQIESVSSQAARQPSNLGIDPNFKPDIGTGAGTGAPVSSVFDIYNQE